MPTAARTATALLLALLLGGAAAVPGGASDPDAFALEWFGSENGPLVDLNDVPLPDIEAALRPRDPISEADLDAAVRALGSGSFDQRETATRRLILLAADRTGELRARLDATDDPEVRDRLRTILRRLVDRPARDTTLRKALASLYATKAAGETEARLARFLTTPSDPEARLFLSLAPLGEVWPKLADRGPTERARYLLLKEQAATADALRDFDRGADGATGGGRAGELAAARRELLKLPASAVFQAATQDIWRTVLQPPVRSGAYAWTWLAAGTRDGVATDVAQMGFDLAEGRDRVVRLQRYRAASHDNSGIGPLIRWDGFTNAAPDGAWEYFRRP